VDLSDAGNPQRKKVYERRKTPLIGHGLGLFFEQDTSKRARPRVIEKRGRQGELPERDAAYRLTKRERLVDPGVPGETARATTPKV